MRTTASWCRADPTAGQTVRRQYLCRYLSRGLPFRLGLYAQRRRNRVAGEDDTEFGVLELLQDLNDGPARVFVRFLGC